MDKYYLAMAQELSSHSHCMRRKVGAVLVSSGGSHVVTAVNNPFPDEEACAEQGCLREVNQIPSGTQLDVCRCIHCETSVIIQCAREGISTLNATVYTTLFPCLACARVLVAAGVKRIIYASPYSDDRSRALFAKAQIQVDQL